MMTKKDQFEAWMKGIIWTCAILALSTPLLTTTAVPSVTYAKATFIQIFIEIAFAAWIFLMLSNRRHRLNWRHPVVLSLLIFLAATLVTLPFSIDPAKSFWSIEMRMMGVWGMAHYIVAALILASTLKSWKNWRILFIYSSLVCLFVDLSSFYEVITQQASRAEATMGNPLYYAAYVLLHIFLGFLLFFKEKNIYWRYAFTVIIPFHIVGLILANSRGPLLALFAAIGSGALFYTFAANGRKKRIQYSVFLVILLAIIAGSVFWMRLPDNRDIGRQILPKQFERVIFLNLKHERLYLWDYAWRGFLERPIAGWGLENSQAVVDKFYDPEDVVFGERWHNRFHNQYMEILNGMGIIGFASYMAIWFSLFYVLYRKFKQGDREDKFAVGALLMLFVAYMFQGITMFDLPVSMLILFCAIGYTISTTHKDLEGEEKILEMNPGVIMPVILFIIMILLAFYFSLRPFQKTMAEMKGHQTILANRQTALEHFQMSVEPETPYTDDLRLWIVGAARLADQYLTVPMPDGQKLAFFVADQLAQTARHKPADSQAQLFNAFAQRFAASYDPSYKPAAIEAAEAALALIPQHPEGYEELAELHFALGEHETAFGYYQQALDHVFRDADKGRIQIRIASLYATMGDYEKALEWLAKDHGKFNVANEPRLAWPLAQAAPEGENELALQHTIQVLNRHKTHPEVIQALILLYKKAGNDQTVADNLKTLYQLYPNMARDFENKYLK